MSKMEGASSSSFFASSLKYHVFLSFRGEDTRYNFAGHLHSALCQRGIRAFMDDELVRGEEISTALLKAIEESKISIVVFSKDYASSKWCLDELVKIIECRKSNQLMVRPVFYKVDPSDVRNQRGEFGDAFACLECKYKDNMEKVHKWRAALSQAANLSGWPLLNECESEAKLIHNIVEEISVHVMDCRYLDVAEYPIGIEPRVRAINELLSVGVEDVRMVGIWGTGGIGKTTIAKAVYNSIAHKFEGSCFLKDVKENSIPDRGLAKLQNIVLFDILRAKTLKVQNADHGIVLMKEMLGHKRVLLVLDDVNDMKQLYYLVGASGNLFGIGSRIIITTRDKKLLTAHHQVNSIHKVKGLDHQEALELFSWNAFNKNQPLVDYLELAERAIRVAGGLPLALKVLGSHLHSESIDIWEAAIDGLIRSRDLHEIFKISYNALDDRVKEVFLDIACFFKGKDRSYVTDILEGCDLNPRYGIEVLIQKALISTEGDLILMHDLIEEMGKEIVHQESPTEPGGRSRLWFYKDVDHVLTENTGTNKVTGIVINCPEQDVEICLNSESFSEMKNLKLFINYNACLSGDVDYLSNKLKVLDWYKCPLQSFPTKFHPKELAVLNIPCNRIKELGERLKHFKKLTFLNLRDSAFLTKIPDLSGTPNLRHLDASGCRSLIEVDSSVGFLDKLEVLDFSFCGKLAKFPKKVSLRSLKRLLLFNCKKITRFPEVVAKIESIRKLSLRETAIKELPASIGHLIGLEDLWLDRTVIKELPSSIQYLTKLKLLCLTESAIEELPSSIGRLTQLEGLWLTRSAIKELPSSVGHLTRLQHLLLDGCENLTYLPQSIYGLQHLRYLNLCRCKNLVTLPNYNLNCEVLSGADSPPLEVQTNSIILHDNSSSLTFPLLDELYFEECNLMDSESLDNLGCFANVREINLSKSNFVRLPVCISKYVNLEELHLGGCIRLKEILELLPPSMAWISLCDCSSLERFPALSKILEAEDMQLITWMNLYNCQGLCDNLGLDVSKMATILLNQMKNFEIQVILPGSEVPLWFSCRKDVDLLVDPIATDNEISKPCISDDFAATDDEILEQINYEDFAIPDEKVCEICIEIPRTFKWENTRLLFCTVFETTGEFPGDCLFDVVITVDGVHISREFDCQYESAEAESSHVWLAYCPLDVDMKLRVDKMSDDQLMPYLCRVTFSYYQGLLMKSCGVHLAQIIIMEDGDENDDDLGGDEDLEHECGDKNANEEEFNAELRSRKRRKM